MMPTQPQESHLTEVANNEAHHRGFFHRFINGTRGALHNIFDATILNTHPCGANIDGMPRMDGAFTKDVVDATVLNTHPCGANVDGMPRMNGTFVDDVADATVFNTHPSGANIDHTVNLW